VERQQDGDHVIYRIRAAYPVALASDPSAIGPFGRAPWLTISSLANYGGMATLYAKLSGPKEHITPEIEQLAEKLTAGIADRREQARAIYNWVSTHIRYVGIWLEQGAVEPHAANTV